MIYVRKKRCRDGGEVIFDSETGKVTCENCGTSTLIHGTEFVNKYCVPLDKISNPSRREHISKFLESWVKE